MIKNFFVTLFGLLLGLFLFAIGLITVAVLVTYPELPELSAVQNYQPREPLNIYSSDGILIGTYGDERREFTKISAFPDKLKNAVIAAEDKRFYEHFGVDLMGIARAALSNLAGGHPQGASTITQQVARNFYLTNERTLTRKFNEALLAYKIETTLTKDQILELYFNHIYLGQRAYGFASAARIYFNKEVRDLSLAEAAILAGLPKAPSAYNPIVNPERAKQRQLYILNNMLELGMISQAEYQEAKNEHLIYERNRVDINQSALYVAEMTRQEMYTRYGERAYTSGYNVYTTVNIKNQEEATRILRDHLEKHDSGVYRGAEQKLDFSNLDGDDFREEAEQFLSNTYTVRGRVPAIVIAASKKNGITAYMQGGKEVILTPEQMGKISSFINNQKIGDKAIQVGALIRLAYNQKTKKWFITQEPELQGALVSLDVNTGAVLALVGGYDYHEQAFNRATQGIRQPGSTFKPFVYSAALSQGMTDGTMVDAGTFSKGKWTVLGTEGSISLRQALTWSKNTVAIRITQAMGIPYARKYIQRFGFRSDQIPNALPLALGAGSATPLQMAEGYAVFANGGYKVTAYVLDKIMDARGNLIAQMKPFTAGNSAPQVIEPRNAYMMNSMLQDVVRKGTATAANSLGRSDLAGKTGTSNDAKDVWFVGYNPKIVTAVYLGYDKPRSLGAKVFGGTWALPVWIDYMRFALKGQKSMEFKKPKDVVRNNGEVSLQESQINTINGSSANENTPNVPLTSDDGKELPPLETPIPKAKINKPTTQVPVNTSPADELF